MQIGKRAAEYGVTASVHHFSYQSIAKGKYCACISIVQLSVLHIYSMYRLVVHSLDQLPTVHGGCIYVNVCACALRQWPHPCRLVRSFHKSFLHEIFTLCLFAKVFLPRKFPAIQQMKRNYNIKQVYFFSVFMTQEPKNYWYFRCEHVQSKSNIQLTEH